MPRAQFKIENQQDAWYARDWIKNQFQGIDFPYSDQVADATQKSIKAESKFEKLKREPEAINAWCEEHLDKAHWKKLKGAIRSSRLRKNRAFGKSKLITRIDISHTAHIMLKRLANHHGVTLSETIELYIKDAWMDLPEEED